MGTKTEKAKSVWSTVVKVATFIVAVAAAMGSSKK